MKYILILTILLPLNLFAADSSRIVAYVGDDIISSLDIEQRMQIVKLINSSDKMTTLPEKELKKQVLKMLIDEKIYRQEAKRLKVSVGEDELKETIEKIQERNKISDDFDQYILKNKLSKNAVIAQIESQLLWTKVIGYKIRYMVNVSQREVDEAMENMGLVSYDLEMKEVSVPFVNSDKNKLRTSLQSYKTQIRGCDAIVDLKNRFGVDFEEQSIDASLNDLRPELRQIIAKTPTGHFTGIAETPDSFQMLMICSKTKQDTEFAEREELENMLLQKKIMQQAEYYIQELRQKTVIDANYNNL